MNIGFRIKELRQSKKITQKELSELLKVDNSQLSKIEQGKLQPTLKQIMELSSILKTTTDWLLTGMGENDAKQTLSTKDYIKKELYDDLLYKNGQLQEEIGALKYQLRECQAKSIIPKAPRQTSKTKTKNIKT